MLDEGIVNTRTDHIFDLSGVDKEVVFFALSQGFAMSTGDQGIIEFAAQEFSDDCKGNFSPLQLIVTCLKKGLIVRDDSKHQILEEWIITEENRQPAKVDFKKITGRPCPGP